MPVIVNEVLFTLLPFTNLVATNQMLPTVITSKTSNSMGKMQEPTVANFFARNCSFPALCKGLWTCDNFLIYITSGNVAEN